jgi:hypothetical protein
MTGRRHSSIDLLRITVKRRTADPETIPGSPIADQSNGLKRGSLAAAVRLRVASEEMHGAEMVHTRRLASAQGRNVSKPHRLGLSLRTQLAAPFLKSPTSSFFLVSTEIAG